MILIVGALTFFPALSLGPIVEHFLMHAGTGVLMATAWRSSARIASPICSIRPIVRRRDRRTRFDKLDPRDDGEEPGDVRGRGRQRPHHAAASSLDADRRGARRPRLRPCQITLWLWFTVLFANFAEAMAEGRGKAQADTLRKARTETPRAIAWSTDGRASRQVRGAGAAQGRRRASSRPARSFPATARSSRASPRSTSRPSPARSAPVIRERGGDRSAVTGGTTRALRPDQGADHREPGRDASSTA